MKLYAFSGLGADERVYDCLQLDCTLVAIPWIGYEKQESLESYSARIARTIDTREPFGVIGLSFGGAVAVEVSKLLKPEFTILVSSAETMFDLPYIFRLLGKVSIIRRMPSKMFVLPKLIAKKLFGTRNELLPEILDDTDPRFVKWALEALLRWQNKTQLANCFKISGSRDRLLPAKKSTSNEIVEDAGHFMIVDRADEISLFINTVLKMME